MHGGKLDQGFELISKPYRREDLAAKIRSVLGNPTAAQSVYPKRILVVEDNDDARDMLCQILDALGYMAIASSSAEEALVMLATHDVDVLLTDVGLPGMSGEDLARQAKIVKPSMAVVFATGYGTVGSLDFPSRTLTKPYDLAAPGSRPEQGGAAGPNRLHLSTCARWQQMQVVETHRLWAY